MAIHLAAALVGLGAAALVDHFLANDDTINPDFITSLRWRDGYMRANGNAILFSGELSADIAHYQDPTVALFIRQQGKLIQASNQFNADPDGDLISACEPYQIDGQTWRYECLFAGDAFDHINQHDDVMVQVCLFDGSRVMARSHFNLGEGAKLKPTGSTEMMDLVAMNMVRLVQLSGTEQKGCYAPMIKQIRDTCELDQRGMTQLRERLKFYRECTITRDNIVNSHENMFKPHSRYDQMVEEILVGMISDEIQQHEHYQTERHAEFLTALASPRITANFRQALLNYADSIKAKLHTQSSDNQAINEALTTLDLSAEATKADIKSAYHELIKQFHPDKLMGLPAAVRDVLEQQAQKINAAYELLQSREGVAA